MTGTSDGSGYRRMVKLSLIHFMDPLIPGPHVSLEHRIASQLFLRYEIGIPMNYIDIGFGLGIRIQQTELEKLANGLRFSPREERPFFTLYDTDFWDYHPLNAGRRIRFIAPMIWSLGYAF